MQFTGEAGNDSSAPTFRLLARLDRLTDVPVEPHQFGIDRKDGAGLRLLNTHLDLSQQLREIGWDGQA